MIYRFLSYELDTQRREVRYLGTPVAIQPKPFSVLEYLVVRNDRMVSKKELLEAFWSAEISEAALQTTMSALRKTLGKEANGQIIKTYHGRGFRFVAELTVEKPQPDTQVILTDLSGIREQRVATVLSVRLRSGHQGDLQDERDCKELDQFLAAARAKVEAEHGRLLHMFLDGFTSVFGLGNQSDDGARRAVSCAWELMHSREARLLSAENHDLICGVHSGNIEFNEDEAEGASWGRPGHIERTASKLASSAATRTILLSETTHFQLRDEVSTEKIDEGYRLCEAPLPRTGIPARPLKIQATFVGRSAELAFLQSKWSSAISGVGQTVVISGAAGIGKSRLTEEFLSSLGCHNILRTKINCLPRLADTPLAPIREWSLEMLQSLPTDLRLDDVDSALLDWLSNETGKPSPVIAGMADHVIRRRCKTLVVELLKTVSKETPVILVFEDVHWIDPVSRGFLEALMQGVDQMHLLLLITTRPTDDTVLSETSLHLPPLGHSDCLDLLHGLSVPLQNEEQTLEAIVHRSAGNPFFLEELLFASGDSGSPPQTKLPETVQAVVETRIASLESGLRPLLYAAAILGPPAPGFWIANLLETTSEALEPGLSRLVRKGFLTDDDDGFSFRHMLLHDTAYAMIAEQDRTRLHADAARFLEALDEPVRPEILAMHLQEAGNAERAIHYWVKASNEALSRSSGQAAITFARKGLALIEHASDKKTSHETNLQLSLATGLMTQRGYGAEGVGQAYSRAYELSLELGAPKARTRALLGLWVHNWVAGSLDDSIAQGKELLELANQAGDPGLRLQGHGGLGSVLMHKGQHKAALEQLLAGVECMPPGKPDKITTQNAAVTCISYAAWVHALQGKTIELHRFAEQSEKISRDIENPFARAIHASLCADAFMCAGEIALCQELADTAVQVSRSNGYPFWLGSGLVLKGWALGQLGQVEQGLSAIEEGIAIFNATQARIQLPNWFGLQAETLLVAGKLEESLTAVEAAFQCAGRTGDVWFLPRVHLIAAHVHQRLGNADDFSRHNNELKIHVKRQELAPSFATLSAL